MVIWGAFRDFENYLPRIRLEEGKENLEVVAVLFFDENVIVKIAGYSVINTEELRVIPYDYIIGLESEMEQDMRNILRILKIPQEKLLMGRVFELPDFDFKQYLHVRERKISIIADNCWGGMTYHSLKLPFLSPFINLFVRKGDFGRLLENFPEYIEKPLRFDRMLPTAPATKKKLHIDEYPVCTLGDVELHFNHYANYDEAKAIWETRKTRINMQNIFAKMLITTEEELEAFQRIPYSKIGFSTIPIADENIIDCSGMMEYIQQEYEGRFWEFVNWQASGNVDIKLYNVLKLLSGERDYKRIIAY